MGVKALRSMGASVDYLVPNRFEHTYGISPEIVREAAKNPSLLITVDNGIAAVEGIAEANRLGCACWSPTIICPARGSRTPRASRTPTRRAAAFPANLGAWAWCSTDVALRAELRRRGAFAARAEPNLAELLDLVALGTVADVVKLDANNRILVSQGIARIRAGKACPGIAALLNVAGRVAAQVTAYDLGFVAGPRINAAGRLDDMSVGIECLLATDAARALDLATRLDRLNRERREIEGEMQQSALAMVDEVEAGEGYSLCIHREEWHTGVVGLLASRLKDRFHRPVFAFASDQGGRRKGSGRAIPGLHLRDALDLVGRAIPGCWSASAATRRGQRDTPRQRLGGLPRRVRSRRARAAHARGPRATHRDRRRARGRRDDATSRSS